MADEMIKCIGEGCGYTSYQEDFDFNNERNKGRYYLCPNCGSQAYPTGEADEKIQMREQDARDTEQVEKWLEGLGL